MASPVVLEIISGLMSSSCTIGKSVTNCDRRSSVSSTREMSAGLVPRAPSRSLKALTERTRSCASASVTNVFHYFHKHAARAEHNHRTVLGIGSDAADEFAVALDHFLNDDAFKAVENSAFFKLGHKIAILSAQFFVRADVHAHAAYVGFVRSALGGHLHHNGVAYLLRGSHCLVFPDGKAGSADTNTVGFEYIKAFTRGEFQAPFGLHGSEDIAHG